MSNACLGRNLPSNNWRERRLVRAISSLFLFLLLRRKRDPETFAKNSFYTISAAKFVEDIVNGDSGLGDVQIKGTKLSSLSLQGSFQALMSLDMDSVENLVQLSSTNLSSEELNKLAEAYKRSGSSSFKSSSRMESFIKSLSNANLKSGLDSSAALSSLFQNIQNSMNDPNGSSTNIFDDGETDEHWLLRIRLDNLEHLTLLSFFTLSVKKNSWKGLSLPPASPNLEITTD